MQRGQLRGAFRATPMLRQCGYAGAYAIEVNRWPGHRSVHVDPDLLAERDDLTHQRLVPASFSDQITAGLRLLVRYAAEEQTYHAAGLVGADRVAADGPPRGRG